MVAQVTDSNFKSEVLEVKDTLVVVDFFAEWCGPCKMMSPALDQVSLQLGDSAKIVKLNTDENQNMSAQYQITGIPCLIVFKNGKEIERLVGFRPAPQLLQDIKGLM
ncbi:MAG: thioredoxin [Candidatus Margulisbacteria bacterium]|nr:thioredoxin [Candidatus Margulisiibacteriota bacterium]